MESTLNPIIVMDFKLKLEPILEMLTNKEKTMAREDWESFVNLSRERIISLPEQYLSGEIPSKEIMAAALDLVFDELQRKGLILTEN